MMAFHSGLAGPGRTYHTILPAIHFRRCPYASAALRNWNFEYVPHHGKGASDEPLYAVVLTVVSVPSSDEKQHLARRMAIVAPPVDKEPFKAEGLPEEESVPIELRGISWRE